ncbi:MAG: response regulator transcription factor [Hyphomicrobiaceae bacterium]
MRLLVVEDNAVQRCIIQSMLSDGEIAVESVGTGKDFRARYQGEDYDALIIDLMLPDIGGLTLINELRADYDSTPIIVISGLSKLADKVKCLEAGADDYLVKPFSHVELLARIRAVARRSFRIRGAAVRVGHISIDERTRRATCGDDLLDLSPAEFKLLVLMARRLGYEVTRDSISAHLRTKRGESSANAIDKLVSRLRNTLAKFDSGVYVRTIRGGGYALEPAKSPLRRDL